jgi:hypothetical protein
LGFQCHSQLKQDKKKLKGLVHAMYINGPLHQVQIFGDLQKVLGSLLVPVGDIVSTAWSGYLVVRYAAVSDVRFYDGMLDNTVDKQDKCLHQV